MSKTNPPLIIKAANKFDENWNRMYFELINYKKRFGNCNVPQHWPENISLGRWVIRQRGFKHTMPEERRDRLNQLGFVWNIYEHVWDEALTKLSHLKKQDGKLSLSSIKDEKLAEWVKKQRKDYMNGEAKLSPLKIKKFLKLGLALETHKRIPWDEQYANLVQYYKQHGHCKVVQGDPSNKRLSSWVSMQRAKKHKLSDEKIKLLDAIEFLWSPKRGNGINWQTAGNKKN